MDFSSFIGQAKMAIDGKGRSAFPREFRRQLTAAEGTEFVVTCGPDHTLRLYVLPEYEKFMAELDSIPDRRQTEIFRKQLSATLVELDGQNRILLPKKLMEFAGLKGDVLYVPARGKSLELWNPERFDAQFGLTTDEATTAFDEMFYGKGLTEGPDGTK